MKRAEIITVLLIAIVILTCFILRGRTPAWQLSSHPKQYPPETLRAIRDKLTESCVKISEGNYDQALQTLKEVLQLDPDQPLALYDLSILYLRNGDSKTAHSLLVKALKQADQVRVKSTVIFIVQQGGILSVYLPEGADDSQLKHNTKESNGGSTFYANGESFVREVTEPIDLASSVRAELDEGAK